MALRIRFLGSHLAFYAVNLGVVGDEHKKMSTMPW
jgi:hypothetical protein